MRLTTILFATERFTPGGNKYTLFLLWALIFLATPSLHAQLEWQRMPGPPGGFAYGSFGLGTGGAFLRLGAAAGVYESADGGINWQWNDYPGTIHTEAALVLAKDGRIWYFDGAELSVSANNGRNWTKVLNNGSIWTSTNVTATQILDTGAIMLGIRGGKVVRSTDSSRTVVEVLTIGGLTNLIRNPLTGHFYAWKATGTAGQINPVRRSTDNGLTWTIWENDALTTGKNITEIVFNPNGAAYLVTNNNLLRSTDDGLTWTELTLKARSVAVTETGRLLAVKEQTLAGFSQYSDDNGTTWQPLPIDKLRKFTPMPGGIILAEHNFSGLYRSTDDGVSWQVSAFGMPNHVDPVKMHFFPDGAALAFNPDGVYYSQNSANNWQHRRGTINNANDFFIYTDLAIVSDSAICAIWDDRLYKSADRGLNWQDITPPQLNPDDELNYVRLVGGVMFLSADTTGLADFTTFRSADAGNTWSDLGNITINSPTMAPDGVFWAANGGSQIQKSTDQGITWTTVQTPPSTGPIPHIFPLLNGDILLIGGGKIHRSSNGGASWSTTTQNGLGTPSISFALANNQLLVLGTNAPMLSVDNGFTWNSLNAPPHYWVERQLFLTPDQYLWFTSGDGAWRSSYPVPDFLTLGGVVKSDNNADCVGAFTEPSLSNFLVKTIGANNQTNYGMSNETGNFRVLATGGTYEISAVVPNDLWETCTTTATIPANITSGNYNTPRLPVKPAVLCPRLEISVAAPLLRRCFDTRLAVTYRNTGTVLAPNAQARIVLDPFIDLLSSSFPIAQQSGDSLWFNLGDLPANGSGTFYLNVNISCQSELGQMHCTEATITPDTLCTNWQGAILRAKMACLGDSVLVEISNVGAGDMSAPRIWQVWRPIQNNIDSLLVAEGYFFLNAGGVFTQKIAATTDPSLQLRVPQETGYPFGSLYAQSFLLHCNGGNNTPYAYSTTEHEPSRSEFCRPNIGSFDPNDKTGYPEGIGAGHNIDKNELLEYLIRFQNTGTDTAFTVVIRDTLSPLLDIETLNIGTSSHPMTVQVRGERELEFRFDHILLPDSNINEAASHGFVVYRIGQKADNPNGAVIRNRAGIYFDFNLPIMTNETWHTVGLPIVSGTSEGGARQPWNIELSPNPLPLGSPLRVEVDNEQIGNIRFDILSLDGRTLETFQVEKNAPRLTWLYPGNRHSTAFFLRISDEQHTETRLVICGARE